MKSIHEIKIVLNRNRKSNPLLIQTNIKLCVDEFEQSKLFYSIHKI